MFSNPPSCPNSSPSLRFSSPSAGSWIFFHDHRFFLFLISPFFLISDFTFFPYFLFHLLSKSKDFDSLPLLASSELQVSFFQWHIILFSRGLNGRISRDLHKLKKLYGFCEEKKSLKRSKFQTLMSGYKNGSHLLHLSPEKTRPCTLRPEQRERAATEVASWE